MYQIYIIKCSCDKYYVGKSSDPEHRYDTHINGMGPLWTQIYKPVELINRFPLMTKFDEDITVKQYMDKYGVDNVRGGTYSSVNLSNEQTLLLEKELATANDKCFVCLTKGHFASYCPNDTVDGCDDYVKVLYEYYVTCYCIWDTHNVIKFIKLNDYTENAQWLRAYIIDALPSINNNKIYKCIVQLKSLLDNHIQMTIIGQFI